MMKNKVYYGEYSLGHWIKLIMKKDIILPDYQRYFVWDEDQIEALVSTLKQGLFIPPIIIGACTIDGKEQNIIIDGQQRLTSILLAYFKVYPKPSEFKESIIELADSASPKRWTFKELTNNFSSIDEIKDSLISDKRYKKLNIDLSSKELQEIYIGFSYIVPEIPDHTKSQAQQNYYSTIFRFINKQGTELEDLESRKALYFLNSNMVNWFEPKLTYKLSDKKRSGRIPFDYIKYISVLTEYNKRHNIDGNRKVSISDCIPTGDTKALEKYYERYIYTFTETDFDDKDNALLQFGTLKDLYPDGKFNKQIEHIQKCIDELNFSESALSSVISLDVHFYGLIYYVVFLKREIDLSKKDSLVKSLSRESLGFANSPEHVKSQKSKSFWEKRVLKSIHIYQHYLK